MEFQYEESERKEKYSMNTTIAVVEVDIHQLARANSCVLLSFILQCC
jgi:hypothetical protein